MSVKTSIEWATSTWIPFADAPKLAPAAKVATRRHSRSGSAVSSVTPTQGFDLRLVPESLELPLRWKKPRRIFVNSMSDLLHEKVPLEYIQRVFAVMAEANQHQYQVLTKRAERLAELSPQLDWRPNIWMGISVESDRYKDRIDALRGTGAHIKFVSLEPLLSPLGRLDLGGIDWVIVGGESGPGARAVQEKWVLEIRDQCVRRRVAFFFKQWGGTQKKRAGRLLEGRTWDEMPAQTDLKAPREA
jgi:protein gp37